MIAEKQMRAYSSGVTGFCRRRLGRGAPRTPAPMPQHLHQHLHQHAPPSTSAAPPAALKDDVESTPSEEPTARNSGEMDVFWSAREIWDCDYYPKPDEVALEKAGEMVKSDNYDQPPLLKLVSNEVTECICNANTGWMDFLAGHAVVRVTFPPGARARK